MTEVSKTNQQFWQRVGVVAAGVWVGIIILLSATQRDFEWYRTYVYASQSHIGPAFVVAVVGVLIIAWLAVGIPWILANKTTSQQRWFRLGIVAAGVWIGTVTLLSSTQRNFEWFPNSYINEYRSVINFGPAFVVAIVGVLVIAAVAVGIPWILAARK